MDSLVRLCAAVNKVRCANPLDSFEEARQMLMEMPPCDIAVFPKLSLTGTIGGFGSNKALIDQCSEALDMLGEATSDMNSYVLTGLVISDYGKPVSVMALLYRGELVAYIPTTDDFHPLYSGEHSEQLMPVNTVFSCGEMRFCVLSCGLGTLLPRGLEIAKTGCDLIIVPSYSPVYAGSFSEVRRSAKALSQATGCAVAVVNGGVGDTSSPFVYNGFVAIYEAGAELASAKASYESFSCTVDIDLDIIHSQKKFAPVQSPVHSIMLLAEKRGVLRQINSNPFLPKKHVNGYLAELFSLQVRSLVARMENIGISRLVIGVSGGLDSTAALLVSAAAVDVLGLPRENIVGIAMPGFGTSDRTYFNSLSLIEQIGATKRDISIRQSVRQHFEDIGHSGKKDTTYENAQARERAQILLDIANLVGGIVVGTGDLSEAALGFTTFAGDHIANYNVNASITKTVLRALVRYIADNSLSDNPIIENISEVLLDILDTPVSPELLPSGENGEIKQKTEDILAPFELLDFFLYYFVKYSFRPSKIYLYACVAFAGKYESFYIKEKLRMFLRSFCAAQFKRACSPDSAAITKVNLSNAVFYIPSDIDSAALLRDLDEVEI